MIGRRGDNRRLIKCDNYGDPSLQALPPTRLAVNEVEGDANRISHSYDIRPFLPSTHHGAVLITTRSAKVEIGHQVPLGKLKTLNDNLETSVNTSSRQHLQNGMYFPS
jgi:hypothetical protein